MSQNAEPSTAATGDDGSATAHSGPAEGVESADASVLAARFGTGFIAGMFAGAIAGVALNSLALGVFWGFILGSVLGVYTAVR